MTLQIVDMTFPIDDVFIETWEHKYDEVRRDEDKYQHLIKQPEMEMTSLGALTAKTFGEMYKWKSARSFPKVQMELYDGPRHLSVSHDRLLTRGIGE